jgi:hypothetical protein
VVPASGALADMAREKAQGDARVAEETIRLMRLSHRATILAQQQQAMYWAKQRRNLETEQGERALIDLDMATCELMSGKLAAAVDQDAVREWKVKILTAMKIYYGLRYLMKYFANFLTNSLDLLSVIQNCMTFLDKKSHTVRFFGSSFKDKVNKFVYYLLYLIF